MTSDQPKIKCVHCRRVLVDKTKDHVFPRSWYPTNTPPTVQRWTVPSCRRCNNHIGEKEKELFVRAAICVPPDRAEAAGLLRRSLDTLGVDVPGLSTKEKRHRRALKNRILREVRPHVPGREHFPGFGPHPDFPEHEQHEIPIPATLIREVSEKIVRGCEYFLGNGRIIEEPHSLSIHFAEDKNVSEVINLFERFKHEAVHLGPGFQVTRIPAHDEPDSVMYKVDIWGTWTIYASIL